MLFHDVPENESVRNALKRAERLVKMRWVPVNWLPHNVGINAPNAPYNRAEAWEVPFRPQQGMVYSSARAVEKFIGFNVSLETFMTALSDPKSVLYTRNLYGTGGHGMGCYYGIVCSCFVSTVLNMPYRIPCDSWPTYPGVQELSWEDLDSLKLCDIVLNPRSHITIITDIQRDEKGHVRFVTVSESTQPFCVAKMYTPEEMRGYFKARGFRLFRKEDLGEIPYEPDPFAPMPEDPEMPAREPFSVLPHFGNKANYILRETSEQVELHVLEEGWNAAEVTLPDGSVRVYPIPEDRTVIPEETVPGYYSARLAGPEKRSVACAWCLTDLKAEVPEKVAAGERIPVRFENALPDPLTGFILNNQNNYIYRWGLFGGGLPLMEEVPTDSEKNGSDSVTKVKGGSFLPEAGTKGTLSLPPVSEPGSYWLILTAKGRYGWYTSRHLHFTVE